MNIIKAKKFFCLLRSHKRLIVIYSFFSHCAVNETIGKCTKCGATFKLSKCSSNKSARFIISSDDGKKWQLTAYDEELHLMTINCTGDTILDKLLNTTTLKLTYDSNNVVRNVDIESN